METSFALKLAADKIQETIDRAKAVGEDAEGIIKRLNLKVDYDAPEEEALNHKMDLKLLMELFGQLSDAELTLEVIALGKLLNNVLKTSHGNDVIVLALGDTEKVPDDSTQLIYQLAKGLFGLHYFLTEDDIPDLADYLTRFRYKPLFLSTIKEFIPPKMFKTIISDYNFNFVEYARSVYEYYYEFYRRGDDPDAEMLKTLESLCDSDKIEFIINNQVSSGDASIEFTYKAIFLKPLEHLIEELDNFRNEVALTVMNSYNEKKLALDRPYHILTDYIRDKTGKIVDREDLSKLFTRWKRILDVYDLRIKEKSYEQIRRKLKIADPRKDYVEAQRLILSAIHGTFPE